MKFIDMHSDTLLLAYTNGSNDIYEMPGMMDVKRLKQADALAQFFAIFMPDPEFGDFKEYDQEKDESYIVQSLDTFYNTMRLHGDIIAPAYNAQDIFENERNGRISALLTFEDGRAIAGNLDNLKHYYEKGIRLITLTWNSENCFGSPNSDDPAVMSKGLSAFGKEAIQAMNELGMLVDVSHLSDGGFLDVAEICSKPFVASHSNCRSLCPHRRNLTDEMCRILGEKGGVAGINFEPGFLNMNMDSKQSIVDLMSRHIRHMINAGGVECVALGSDFDGISGTFEVNGPEKIHLIFEQLHRDGVSDDVIEKIAYGNALRVIKDAMA